MHELNFDIGKIREIKINGEKYAIKVNDLKVCEILNDLAEKQIALAKSAENINNAKELFADAESFANDIDKAIDTMLGIGTAEKIFKLKKNATVTADEKAQIAATIGAGIVAVYKEEAEAKYKIEGDK